MSEYQHLFTQLQKYGWSLLQGSGENINAHCRLENPLIKRIMNIYEASRCHNSLMTLKVAEDHKTKKEHQQKAIDTIKLLSDGWSIDTSTSNEVEMWWKQIHDGGRRIPYSEELQEIANRIQLGEYFNQYFEKYHSEMDWILNESENYPYYPSSEPSSENDTPSQSSDSTPASPPLQFHTNPIERIEFDLPTLQFDPSVDTIIVKELISEIKNLATAKVSSRAIKKEIAVIEAQIISLQNVLYSLKKSVGEIKKIIEK